MMIKRLIVKNWRNFRHIDVRLRDHWDLKRVASVSVSLKRTLNRIRSLYPA